MGGQTSVFGSAARYRAFTAVKYLVYLLLSINIFMFLSEELLALEHTFAGELAASDYIQVFSATIDTSAWVLLLLLFELETSVLDDQRLRGAVKWLIFLVRVVCYGAILYSFYGYYIELVTLYQAVELQGFDACARLSDNYSLLVDLDEYLPLAADNCGELAGGAYQIEGFRILAPPETLQAARLLAWVDVINSATWILVVLVLEVEVWLQLMGRLSDRIMGGTRYLKFALYGILFACAFYWGYAGDFIDVWDASLWLFAFIFIELNVFEWQYETTHAAAAPG